MNVIQLPQEAQTNMSSHKEDIDIQARIEQYITQLPDDHASNAITILIQTHPTSFRMHHIKDMLTKDHQDLAIALINKRTVSMDFDVIHDLVIHNNMFRVFECIATNYPDIKIKLRPDLFDLIKLDMAECAYNNLIQNTIVILYLAILNDDFQRYASWPYEHIYEHLMTLSHLTKPIEDRNTLMHTYANNMAKLNDISLIRYLHERYLQEHNTNIFTIDILNHVHDTGNNELIEYLTSIGFTYECDYSCLRQ